MASPQSESVGYTSGIDSQALYFEGAILLQRQLLSTGIELAHFRHSSDSIPTGVEQQHVILIHTEVSAGTQVEQTIDEQYQTAEMKVGDVIIVPAHSTCSSSWNREHSYLALMIKPDVFEKRLREHVVGNSIELLSQFMLSDSLLFGVGNALKQELQTSGLGGQLYIDALLGALFAHLLQYYCTQKPIHESYAGGLPKYKLQQVVDYIHAHLDRELALADLAAIAQISPNYFTTQFKQSIGFAPHQYVIQQRVERAKKLLVNGEEKIVDIAYQVGFTHQSHLTRHFKRLVGVTPKQFLIQQ
jgi:AraC family transcriptional regulator